MAPTALRSGDAAPHSLEGTGPEPLLVAVALFAAMAVGGFFLAGLSIGGGSDRAGPGAAGTRPDNTGAYSVGEPAPTGFGTLAVNSTDSFGGPTAEDLGGQVHGVADLVAANRSQLEVAITLTNRDAEPVHYSWRQFSVVAGRGDEAPADRIPARPGSVEPGALAPGASVTATASFVVPRRDRDLLLSYAEGPADDPVLIDLGKTSTAPPAAGTGPHPAHGR